MAKELSCVQAFVTVITLIGEKFLMQTSILTKIYNLHQI